jgi:CRP/FNR family transcriptional regulator, cyclic AMP receptor protein
MNTTMQSTPSSSPQPEATLEAQIAEHPFGHDLSLAHVQALAECAMPAQFVAGELIFREGDPANRFYLVQSGKVVLESRTEGGLPVRIGAVGPGEVLGWSWLFPPYAWHFDARAVEPVTAIFFYATRLREFCDQNHDLGYELLKRMAAIVVKRLQITRRQLIESYRMSAKS